MLVPRRPAEPHEEHVARDREQVRAEARGRPELIARLDARQERLLREVVRLAGDLVLEEAVDVGEVAPAELLARARIAGAPARQQLEVGVTHARSLQHRRRSATPGAPARAAARQLDADRVEPVRRSRPPGSSPGRRTDRPRPARRSTRGSGPPRRRPPSPSRATTTSRRAPARRPASTRPGRAGARGSRRGGARTPAGPNVVVPGGTRQTILWNSAWLPAASAPSSTRCPLSIQRRRRA